MRRFFILLMENVLSITVTVIKNSDSYRDKNPLLCCKGNDSGYGIMFIIPNKLQLTYVGIWKMLGGSKTTLLLIL